MHILPIFRIIPEKAGLSGRSSAGRTEFHPEKPSEKSKCFLQLARQSVLELSNHSSISCSIVPKTSLEMVHDAALKHH